jgi:hypothetical protein
VHTSPQLRARTDFGNFHVSTINALEVIKITGPSESQSDSDLSGQPWANVLSSVDVSRTGSRLSWKTGWLGKDTNARPTGFEVGARSRHTERAFTGSAEFNLSSRFSVTGRGSRTRVGYDADAIYNDSSLNETLDKTVVGGGGGVGIRITPLTGVFVTVDYLDETYHRAPELDNTGILTLGGFSFRTGAIVAGTIAMGYRTSTNGAGEHPLASPQTLVTLTHTRPSGASITATINRDSQQSYDINRGALTTFSTGLQGTLTPVKGWTGYWSFVHAALTYSVPEPATTRTHEYIVGASHSVRLRHPARGIRQRVQPRRSGLRRRLSRHARRCVRRLRSRTMVEAARPAAAPLLMRIAYLSPLPPDPSGVADYSAELLPWLRRECEVDAYTAAAHAAAVDAGALGVTVRPYEAFAALADRYDALLAHFSCEQAAVGPYEVFERFGGIAVLHDLNLSGLFGARVFSSRPGYYFFPELWRQEGAGAALKAATRFLLTRQFPGTHDYWMSRGVIRRSRAVIVHSHWSRDWVAAAQGGRSQAFAVTMGVPLPERPTRRLRPRLAPRSA